MGKFVVVTGGARSGKSSFAEEYVKKQGETVLYVATAIPFDEEMKDRVRKHKESRPKTWTTWEGYRGIRDLLISRKQEQSEVVLIDCLTILVTNIMLEHSEMDFEQGTPEDWNIIEADVQKEVGELIQGIEEYPGTVVMVTNELGSGIVPENKMARAFRDIAGRANQMVGKAADELYLSVCGVPIQIK